MKKIRLAINFMKNKRVFKKKLKDIEKYLYPGKYIYNGGSLYLHNKIINSKYIDQYFTNRMRSNNLTLDSFIKKILSWPKIKISHKIQEYKGTFVTMTSYSKSFKIFDVDKKVIITKYFKYKDYQNTIDNLMHFHTYFPAPIILKKNKEENIIIEEFIMSTNVYSLNYEIKDKLIQDIFRRSINYLENARDKISLDYYPFLSSEKKMNHEILIGKVKVLGDLKYKNILYNQEKFYYIDFELSSEQFILYDILTFIFFSYYDHGDYKYFHEYFKGGYDKELKKMFDICGLKFNPKYKTKYFEIYLIERLKIEDEKSGINMRDFFHNKIKNYNK